MDENGPIGSCLLCTVSFSRCGVGCGGVEWGGAGYFAMLCYTTWCALLHDAVMCCVGVVLQYFHFFCSVLCCVVVFCAVPCCCDVF